MNFQEAYRIAEEVDWKGAKFPRPWADFFKDMPNEIVFILAGILDDSIGVMSCHEDESIVYERFAPIASELKHIWLTRRAEFIMQGGWRQPDV